MKLIVSIISIYFSITLGVCALNQTKFLCARTQFQLPGTKVCTHTRVFDYKLDQAFKDHNQELAETRFEILNALHNNANGSLFYFQKGPKKVYRTAMLMGNIGCLDELINVHGVRHIIDIANPISYDTEPWTKREKKYFFELAPSLETSQYIEIPDLYYKYKNEKEKEFAYQRVVEIIYKIEDLDGPVLLHCLGGEQKTGVIYGIMQKCINKVPMSEIIEEYKCHTAWQSPQNLGGYRQWNVDFIKNFPCEYLTRN